jgi:ABC-type branched-subunit amino acid transport system ATPase component/ABC-type branched-subunit amino acid transport system permease subunit
VLEARSRFDTLPVALAVMVLLLPLGFALDDVVLLTLSMGLAFGLAALGVDFLLGYAGQPTMGQSAFVGIGAYVSALAMARLQLPFIASIVLAAGVCALLAGAIGLAAVKLQRLGFAIVTFMFSYVVFVLLGGRLLIPIIGATGGLQVAPAEAFGVDLTSGRSLFFLSLGLLAASLLLCARFVRSRSGLALVTLKQSETVAEVLGIDVHAVKRHAFIVSAILAALCGVIFAQAASYLTAESFDPTMSVAIFGMAAVGGFGTLVGPVFGALFYRLIPEVARDLQQYQSILFAVLMVLALMVFRDGLYGLLHHLIARKTAAPSGVPTAPSLAPQIEGSAAPAPVDELLLSVSRVSLAFGGVKALTDVSMGVFAGSTHALIGANGAGKTTLLNCISGILRVHTGDIRLHGSSTRRVPARRLRRLGIARTFQNPALSPDLTLLQNAKLGLYASHSWSFWLDWCGGLLTGARERRILAGAAEALALVGLPADRWHVLARDASFGEQKLVDLARALAGAHSLLLLDEPAAGLTGIEIENVVRLLAHLRAVRRLTIVLVSHHVQMVRDVADRVTVLDFGRVLAEGTPGEVVRDRRVIDAFFGELHSAA